MLIDHKNHGMHSSTNKVILENFISDVKPTRLTAAIQDNTSIISVVDGSNFTTFEGSPVSNSNPGYLLIDKEIISYEILLQNFWLNIDPFDAFGQFCDKGYSYRSVAFYQNDQIVLTVENE